MRIIILLIVFGYLGCADKVQSSKKNEYAKLPKDYYQYRHILYGRKDTCSSLGGFWAYSDILHYKELMIEKLVAKYEESTVEMNGMASETRKWDSVTGYRITNMLKPDYAAVEIDKLDRAYSIVKKGTYFSLTGNGSGTFSRSGDDKVQEIYRDTTLFDQHFLYKYQRQLVNEKDSGFVSVLLFPQGNLKTLYTVLGYPSFDHITVVGYFVHNDNNSTRANCIINFKDLEPEVKKSIEVVYEDLLNEFD